jgi:hypothetical protein
MITIYQIRLTDSDIDTVNTFGWNSVPAANVRADIMLGAYMWKDEYLKYYTPVYEVNTNDLEQAFESTNLWNDDRVRRLARGSSSSVGDLFVKDGQYYIVDSFGFAAIHPEMESV